MNSESKNMLKEKLIENLVVMRDTFFVCYFSIGILDNLDLKSIGKINMELRDPITKRSSKVSEKNLKLILNNKEAMTRIRYESGTTFRKAFLNGTLELLRDYCKITKQEVFLSQQEWYPFSRILRNVSAHHIDEREIDWPQNYTKKEINEVSWKGKTIKKGMKGNEVKYSDLECFELFEYQLDFVLKSLK